MPLTNSKPIQKAFLLTLFQSVLILLMYTYFAMNNRMDEVIYPEITCMKTSDSSRLCMSVFKRNQTQIPYNKGIQVESLHKNDFKILLFKGNDNTYQKNYIKRDSEYFQLVNYNTKMNHIQKLTLDLSVPSIMPYVQKKDGAFLDQQIQNIDVSHQIQQAVFYFVLPQKGLISKIEPQIRIIHPNHNSVTFNNLVNIIQSLASVAIIFGFLMVAYSQSHANNLFQFCLSQQSEGKRRCLQFLLNFASSNLIFYFTTHKLWTSFGLEFINDAFGFQTLVKMTQANIFQSYLNLFPQWLILAYFIFQVLERYFNMKSLQLILLSGLSGAVLFILPSVWMQLVFQFPIIVGGLVLGSNSKHDSNNKLSISLVFTAFNLICMVLVKMYWVHYNKQSNDFALRFVYYQIFTVSTFISVFFTEDDTKAQQNRTYIPYDDNSMQEEPQFDQHQTVPYSYKV